MVLDRQMHGERTGSRVSVWPLVAAPCVILSGTLEAEYGDSSPLPLEWREPIRSESVVVTEFHVGNPARVSLERWDYSQTDEGKTERQFRMDVVGVQFDETGRIVERSVPLDPGIATTGYQY